VSACGGAGGRSGRTALTWVGRSGCLSLYIYTKPLNLSRPLRAWRWAASPPNDAPHAHPAQALGRTKTRSHRTAKLRSNSNPPSRQIKSKNTFSPYHVRQQHHMALSYHVMQQTHVILAWHTESTATTTQPRKQKRCYCLNHTYSFVCIFLIGGSMDGALNTTVAHSIHISFGASLISFSCPRKETGCAIHISQED
jgi:hypothetical protein